MKPLGSSAVGKFNSTFGLAQDLVHSDNFQYIQLEKGTRRYLGLDQNFVVLFWILFFEKDTIRTKIRSELKFSSLRLIFDGFSKGDLLSFFKNNFVTLLRFVSYKYKFRKPKAIVCLPFYGHTCVQVHKGYKIFDLRRGVVIKFFDPDVSIQDISNEIEQMKIISPLKFAPSLRKWDILKRWYEEDYFVGTIEASSVPMDSEVLLGKFFQELVPHATNLIFLKTPFVKNNEQYIDDLIRSLEATCAGGQVPMNKNSEKVKKFIQLIVDQLKTNGKINLFHVFAHGDFCPENILKTQHGIKIIDWESAKYRSVLFDFYSYFFYRPFQKNVPVKALVFEINEALPYFISKLSEKLPEVAKNILAFESFYRKTYYLERISMLAEREITDKRLDIWNDIFRYIEAFESYEQMLPLLLPTKAEV